MNVNMDYLVRRQTVIGWKIGPREIRNFELVMILKGHGTAEIGKKKYFLSQGDLLVIRPEVCHFLTVDREPCMEFYGLHFMEDEPLKAPEFPEYVHLENPSRLLSLFRTAMDVLRQRDSYCTWRRNILVEQILCEILTLIETQQEPSGKSRVKKVLTLIHQNPFKRYTLEELVSISGIRKTAFMEAFRSLTGTTPIRYLTGLRMEEAAGLLQETNLSVADVAERCGFEDPFYFSRCFKQHFSLSPRQYRTKLR